MSEEDTADVNLDKLSSDLKEVKAEMREAEEKIQDDPFYPNVVSVEKDLEWVEDLEPLAAIYFIKAKTLPDIRSLSRRRGRTEEVMWLADQAENKLENLG